MPLRIAIIGGGVNGLCCGVQITEFYKNAEVTIIAEDFTPNTTGDGSAGLWGPYLMGSTKNEDIYKWSKSMHMFLEKLWISGNGGLAGICLIPVIRVTTNSSLNCFWKDLVYGLKDLTNNELHQLNNKFGKKFKKGVFYVTYTSEPTKLLPYLMELFRKNNGTLIKEKVKHIEDFTQHSKYDVIINCTGLGSKNIVNDQYLHPVRGQVVRVKADWLLNVFIDESDDGIYIIPNCDSIVLGGTHQINDYNVTPDRNDKKFIISDCYNVIPSLINASFIADWVGLRPGRHEVRIEKEIQKNGKIVIHNYGHGGSGVTLCWGCASEVLQLLKSSAKL